MYFYGIFLGGYVYMFMIKDIFVVKLLFIINYVNIFLKCFIL